MKITAMVILSLIYSQILGQYSAREIIYDTNISLTQNKIDTLFGEIIPTTTAYDTYEYLSSEKRTLESRSKIKEYLWQHWDGAEWQNFRKELYTYNLEGQLITFLTQMCRDGIWVNESISKYKYLNNLRMEGLFQKWRNSKWENDKKYEFEYDAENKLSTWLELRYRESKWNNKRLVTYTYNENDSLTLWLEQKWIPNHGWICVQEKAMEYDSNNKVIEKVRCDANLDGSLIKHWRWSYTYDVEGNLVSNMLYQWENERWVKDWLIDLYYGGTIYLSEKNDWKESGGLQGFDSLKFGLSEIWYPWITFSQAGETWCSVIACESDIERDYGHYLWRGDEYSDYENSKEWFKFEFYWMGSAKTPFCFTRRIEQEFKTTFHYAKWDVMQNLKTPLLQCVNIYNYDENNNCVERIIRNDKGINIKRYGGEYDGINNLVYQFDQEWNIEKWEDKDRHFLTYTSLTEVSKNIDDVIDFNLLNNYPNPFNPSTTIEYSLSSRSFVTLKVFDVLGREVETIVNKEQSQGNYEVEFNATDLTSGVYFYRIQAGEFVQTKKMILMK